jgi:SAM-dependent methyltransferase
MPDTNEPAVVFAEAVHLDQCPVCASPRLHHALTGCDYHYQTAGEFSADRCGDCGLVFVNPMPSAADLAALYPEDYYSYQPPRLLGGPKHWLKSFVGLRKKALLPHFDRPGTMLDIGCGAGQYLLEMKARGWTVYGAELSKAAAAAGRAAGLDIRGGELMSAGFESGMFDFVRSNHSFEHIPNPQPVLAEIRRVLKPDGKLFIGVPNVDGAMARLFGRYWWYVGLPVHTYGYNPRNLSMLLRDNGFAVERVRYYSDYGGTLGSLQIYLNRHDVPRSSDGRVVRSLLLRLPGQYLARLLDLFRQGDCIEVIARPERGPGA